MQISYECGLWSAVDTMILLGKRLLLPGRPTGSTKDIVERNWGFLPRVSYNLVATSRLSSYMSTCVCHT